MRVSTSGENHRAPPPDAPKGNHQAEDEEQVIDSVEDVEKAQEDEAQERLVPAGIQVDHARIAGILEDPLPTRRRHEVDDAHGLQAQVGEGGVDGEARLIRIDGHLEEHVQQGLLGHELGPGFERWREHVRERPFEGGERPVGGQRDPGRHHPLRTQGPTLLVELDVVGDPKHRGLPKDRGQALQNEVPRPPSGEVDIAKGGHGSSDQENERRAHGLHVHLDRHVRRNLVGAGRPRERSRCQKA